MTDTTTPGLTSEPARPAPGPPPAAVPPGTFTHRQILTILAGLMLGMFLAALDQTIVATSIRTIADDLQGFSLQAWATTAFLITSTISTPLYGKLSDLYGRKPFFLAAISIFLFGSALCGLSQSMYELAAFRAIQGLGAGGLFSMALAIIGDIVPPRERSRYQGYFLAVFGTSSVLGPVVGGLLAGATSIGGVAGWRWIFYLNIPIGFAALVVVTKVLHLPHEQKRHHRIDWPGALALVVCLVPLLTVAEQGRTWGWGSGGALACYGIGLLGLVAFIVIEAAYGEEALLPLRMMRGRTFAVGSVSSLIVGIGMFGALAVLPQYLQIVKGSSPTVGGLQLLPLVLGIMSGAVISGQVIARTGRYKRFPVTGTSFMIIALLLFSLVGADTPLWRTMLVMLLFGLGLGFNMQPIILAVQNAVSPRQMGVATSSVTFFRQMGGTLGTAVFLSVLFSTLTGNISHDVRAASATPAFQQAIAEHPDQAAIFSSSKGSDTSNGPAGALEDTSFINRLDDRLAAPFRSGFSDSMDLIFLLAAGVLVIGLVSTSMLPELPLRTQSGIQARADETGEGEPARDSPDGPPEHDPSGIPSDLTPGPAVAPTRTRHPNGASPAAGRQG